MSSDVELRTVVASALPEVDKAVVALWLTSSPGNPQSAASIAAILERAGSPRINRSRLKDRLSRDRRTVKEGDGFRIAPKKASDVASLASPLVGPVLPTDTKSVLDSELFEHAYAYIKNIAHQINASFDIACYDCTAVMIRRLFETLIIDSFEKQGCISEIKDNNGEIFSLSVLISRLSATVSFTVSRQTKQAASHLKDVGDWSAHNRRHKARRSDIEAAARHLRLAASDLLHLAGQDGPAN